MKFEFRRMDVAPRNEEFMLANVDNVDNVDRNKQTARNSMFQRKSTKLTHPISVIEFCVFLRFSLLVFEICLRQCRFGMTRLTCMSHAA